MILAGDIGGTNARLALFAPKSKRPARVEVFESRKFQNLETVVRIFLGPRAPRITSACFGVAGPVVRNRCEATNLPWVIDGRVLARKLKLRSVQLINDLVALSIGALTAPPSKLHLVHGSSLPRKKGATLAVIAAGTGLGEAALFWNGRRFLPCGTEGGHTDFAPRDEIECELLLWMRKRLGGRVSYERLLSGNGFGALYDFFREVKKAPEPRDVTEAIATAPDRNAAISHHGTEGSSEACVLAVERFVGIYGAEAGNLALKMLATGGVFVAGNIAAHVMPVIERGGFAKSFGDKGRFGALLENVPVAVVMDSQIGLAGSAHYAQSFREFS